MLNDCDDEDGFSSNSDERQQMSQLQASDNKQMEVREANPHLRCLIPPPQQIKKRNYSLHADIATGWSPKITIPKPVTLTYNNDHLDDILDFLIKAAMDDVVRLCYLGPRFTSTYSAWKVHCFEFPYNHVKNEQIQYTNRKFFGNLQRSQKHNKEGQCLVFDSVFQSGNLDAAFRLDSSNYDLFMRVDTNTRGHLQWYYFRVKNLQKDKNYKFTICNFVKGKSLYSRGMKPYIRSQKDGKGWNQSGENVSYEKRTPKVMNHYNIEVENNRYYCLSFQYKTSYEEDQIEISYCIPYTYTKMLNFLEQMKQKTLENNILAQQILSLSLGGNKIPLLTITQNVNIQIGSRDKIQPKKKKLIFMTGRVHPGQSNGSFVTQGIIRFLCSDQIQAIELRKSYVFKIVPMLNPDGVIMGNYRTGISGRDLNRVFSYPEKQLFIEIYELKQIIQKYKIIYGPLFMMYLDFHGHSVKKNVFAYGPQFPIMNRCYYESRVFPKLLSKKTDMFRYYSCAFRIASGKQSTARAVLLRNFGIQYTYTIETSNGSYYDQDNMRNILFTEVKWLEMGAKVGETIYQLYKIVKLMEDERQRKIEEKQRKIRIKADTIKRVHSSKSRGVRTVYPRITPENYLKKSIQKPQQNQFKTIFEEIQKEQKDKFQECSEDQLSEGGSDSQGDEDDLNLDQIRKFLKCKNKKPSQRKIMGNGKETVKKIIKKSSLHNEEEEQVSKQDTQKRLILGNKLKKIYYRKRIQCSGSISPVKQYNNEEKKNIKIVNFNFAVNPVPNLSSFSLCAQKIRVEKGIKTQADFEGEQQIIKNRVQMNEPFRKTLQGIQRDIYKRDNIKRNMNGTNFGNIRYPFKGNQMICKKMNSQPSQ